jgi:gliding motility-associated lipoprotein GldH
MIRLIALFGVLLLTSACDSKMVVGEMRDLPNHWGKLNVLEFQIPALDSLETYNMFLHIRNTNDYPFNNIHVIANIQFPHGKIVTDTLEYRMANADGTWIGTGIGSVKENKFWYKENVTFTEEGTYSLILSQAVRNNGEVHGVSELEGITEVGYSIELANQ